MQEKNDKIKKNMHTGFNLKNLKLERFITSFFIFTLLKNTGAATGNRSNAIENLEKHQLFESESLTS